MQHVALAAAAICTGSRSPALGHRSQPRPAYAWRHAPRTQPTLPRLAPNRYAPRTSRRLLCRPNGSINSTAARRAKQPRFSCRQPLGRLLESDTSNDAGTVNRAHPREGEGRCRRAFHERPGIRQDQVWAELLDRYPIAGARAGECFVWQTTRWRGQRPTRGLSPTVLIFPNGSPPARPWSRKCARPASSQGSPVRGARSRGPEARR